MPFWHRFLTQLCRVTQKVKLLRHRAQTGDENRTNKNAAFGRENNKKTGTRPATEYAFPLKIGICRKKEAIERRFK